MKVPFGFHKKTNRYMGIDDALNGLRCGCICPSCKMELMARQGDENEHHFAHHKLAEVECEYSYWVAVRSMAKQILSEKGIFVDYSRIKTFASMPWTEKAVAITKGVSLEHNIRHYQFDAKVDASFGPYYIHLLTDRENDSGRVRSHFVNQEERNTFSPYLVLEVDLGDIKKHRNEKANECLDSLLTQKLQSGDWFSSRSSYLDYLRHEKRQEKIEEERKELAARRREEYGRQNHTVPSPKRATKDDTDIVARRMVGFHETMLKSYSYDDKLSQKLSIVYKGRNLWYVSCCNEFFCISYQGTHIVYEVLDEKIIRLTSSISFGGLEAVVEQFIKERNTAF